MSWLLELLAALAAGSYNSRNSVVVGGSSAPVNMSPTQTYRSRDGSSFFRFRFARVGDGIRIYILELPNPARGSCHILSDSRGQYICWEGTIERLSGAQAIAAVWAEATLVYQRTGRTF